MSSEYTVTAEDRARFGEMARRQLHLEPTPARSPARTIGLWLVLIVLFIGLRWLFAQPETAVSPVTPDSPLDLVSTLGLGAGGVAFFRRRADHRRSTGPTLRAGERRSTLSSFGPPRATTSCFVRRSPAKPSSSCGRASQTPRARIADRVDAVGRALRTSRRSAERDQRLFERRCVLRFPRQHAVRLG
jgi:hypothetical protein